MDGFYTLNAMQVILDKSTCQMHKSKCNVYMKTCFIDIAWQPAVKSALKIAT